MISPKETFIYCGQLLDYICERLDREVEFVQRKSYGEANGLLDEGPIDLAFEFFFAVNSTVFLETNGLDFISYVMVGRQFAKD